jgi:release factor glutamine methyltransferase
VASSVEQFHQSGGGGSWDLIVSNPPYVPDHEIPNEPEVQHYDPPMALFGG